MYARKTGFTLYEVLIVIVILGILLSIMVFLGSNYLKDLQVRSEKESVLNTLNYALSYVKSTNYYRGENFSYIDVSLTTGGVALALDSGTGFADTIELARSVLSFSGDVPGQDVRLYPYVRACEDIDNELSIVPFSIQGTRNDAEFCFSWDMELCKIFVVSCE